ncbi:phage tail tube protein [Salininema proteolyticum]|uniref:Major tail protein n=1 Tax=Salininema proteolyticum TaxID=1607685 RepID=A0ABV8U017_9ACTN
MKNDSATLVVGSGNYFVAPVGTALPDDLLSPTSPWDNIGHTSLEEILAIEAEGGEATSIGTLQNKTLRTVYSPRTETLRVTLQQFDTQSLRLFFGSNMETLSSGMQGVPTEAKPSKKAFLAVFLDGESYFAIWAPHVEIFRADNPSLGDGQTLAGLPLGVKPLAFEQNTWTYAITPLGDTPVEAETAWAGKPGSFEPYNAVPPADLQELGDQALAAQPSEAWDEGEYIVLGDATEAHWDGTAWTAGKAPAPEA